MSFKARETDIVTGEPTQRLIANPAKRKTFLQLLTRTAAKEHKGQIPKAEMKSVEELAAFLDRATALDPAARLTVADAMASKFVMGAKLQISKQQQSAQRKAGKP